VSRSGLVAAALAFWSLGTSVEPASAQPGPDDAVRFRYEAPVACPDVAAFTARVRQRTSRGREARPEELARTFALSISPDALGFLGTIEFLDDAGVPVSRRVHGEECDAVVSSLALITALALDATLREQPAPGFEQPAPPRTAVPAQARQPTPASPRPSASLAPRRARGAPLLVSARIGASLAHESLLGAPVLGLLGQLDFRNGWSLRLLAHYEDSTIEVDTGREVSVRLIGLETSVCPLHAHVDEFSFYPCASFDMGSLRAAGERSSALPLVYTSTLLWASLGPELRLAWEPAAALWLELRGATGVPLVRRTFELQNPQQTALDVQGITFQAGFSGGVRFW
jgi:hypothetical protein